MTTRKLAVALSCFAGWLFLSPLGALAQVRAYMKIEGIQGPCTEDAHRGWIEIQEASRDVYGPANQLGPELLAVSKLVDISSAQLQQAFRNGTQLREVVLEFTRPGRMGAPVVFQRLALGFAKITSLNQQYAAGGNVEKIRFSYGRVKQEDRDPERNTTFITGWDFVHNAPS